MEVDSEPGGKASAKRRALENEHPDAHIFAWESRSRNDRLPVAKAELHERLRRLLKVRPSDEQVDIVVAPKLPSIIEPTARHGPLQE